MPGWGYPGETDAEGRDGDPASRPDGGWSRSRLRPRLPPEYYSDKLTFQTADRVTVADGTTTTGIDASLVDGGKITGTVTDPSGKPLSGMCVVAQQRRVTDSGVGGDRTGGMDLPDRRHADRLLYGEVLRVQRGGGVGESVLRRRDVVRDSDICPGHGR